jgi:hypothetical protein
MRFLAFALSITSGFALMHYRLAPLDTIMTSAVIDLALAPITAIVAYRRNRSLLLWIVLGLVCGVWALAWVLIFPLRRPRRAEPDDGHPSEAA